MEAMEESLVIAGLSALQYQERTRAIEMVRAGLRRHGRLRFHATDKLFTLLADTLHDTNWNVRRDTIALLTEIIPDLVGELGKYNLRILPGLLQNMGDPKVAIRRGAISAVQVRSSPIPFSPSPSSIFLTDSRHAICLTAYCLPPPPWFDLTSRPPPSGTSSQSCFQHAEERGPLFNDLVHSGLESSDVGFPLVRRPPSP